METHFFFAVPKLIFDFFPVIQFFPLCFDNSLQVIKFNWFLLFNLKVELEGVGGTFMLRQSTDKRLFSRVMRNQ